MTVKKDKPCEIHFADQSIFDAYKSLEFGDEQSKRLFKFINRAFDDIVVDPTCGIKIKKDLWPKDYIRKHHITNLWKYDLPGAWRLIYSIFEDEIKIMNVVLEWMTHKEYERKFKY